MECAAQTNGVKNGRKRQRLVEKPRAAVVINIRLDEPSEREEGQS
jgi:hypothetical protein